jgi:hypothetical protein
LVLDNFANHKKILVTLIVLALVTAAATSYLVLTVTASVNQEDRAVATVNLQNLETFSYAGVPISFNRITVYHNQVVLLNESRTTLTASPLGQSQLTTNISLGSTTTVSMSDPGGIKVQSDGLAFTVHNIVITVSYSGSNITGVNWQAT